MTAVVNFFEGIGEAIISIFDFIVSFFQDLVYMVQLIGQIILQLPGYFSWLPSGIVSLLLTLFGIVVIYKILGREG